MPSPFSLGVQNADEAFDAFADNGMAVGSVSMTTAETESAVAHGMSAAPDWVLLTGNTALLAGEGLGWAATATTLTIVKTDTNGGNLTVSYIAGNLS